MADGAVSHLGINRIQVVLKGKRIFFVFTVLFVTIDELIDLPFKP